MYALNEWVGSWKISQAHSLSFNADYNYEMEWCVPEYYKY